MLCTHRSWVSVWWDCEKGDQCFQPQHQPSKSKLAILFGHAEGEDWAVWCSSFWQGRTRAVNPVDAWCCSRVEYPGVPRSPGTFSSWSTSSRTYTHSAHWARWWWWYYTEELMPAAHSSTRVTNPAFTTATPQSFSFSFCVIPNYALVYTLFVPWLHAHLSLKPTWFLHMLRAAASFKWRNCSVPKKMTILLDECRRWSYISGGVEMHQSSWTARIMAFLP